MRKANQRQAGIGMVVAVAGLIIISVIFLTVFLISSSGSKTPNSNNQNQTNQNQAETSTSSEPSYIRVPENSLIYKNSDYNFMFAYPDSFGQLTQKTDNSSSAIFRVESALATQKPVGNTGAVMKGYLGAYVYKKEDFKIIVGDPNVFVGPTKTGNDITWKIVSVDKTDKDISVGDAYNVTTIKSQTSVTVFDFSHTEGTSMQGRLVFTSGDYFVLIAMPNVAHATGDALSKSDLAAYKIILTNIAKTVRVPDKSDSSSSDSSSLSDSSSTDDSSSSGSSSNSSSNDSN
jgi:hypothetical protein